MPESHRHTLDHHEAALDAALESIEDLRKRHRRSHPLALWLAATSVVLGLIIALDPTSTAVTQSPSLGVMPLWGVVLWGINYALGGVLALIGLVQRRLTLEAAGWTLIASAYAATLVSLVLNPLVPVTPVSLLFLIGMAGGAAHRAFNLGRE